MEILTLLKANIIKKKGTYLSIVILTAMIVTCITAIFSAGDNYDNAIKRAFQDGGYGETVVMISPEVLTPELLECVENSSLVKQVKIFDALISNGSTVDEWTDNNSWFLLELRDGIRLFNEELNGFEENIPELHSGEIYVPVGVKTTLKCKVGDVVRINFLDGIHEFKIKGFVQEPANGSASIGWKQVFISGEDFHRLLAANKPIENESSMYAEAAVLMLYKADDCTLSDAAFQRQLNLETGIVANAFGAITKADSLRYTGLLFGTVFRILQVFMGMLFVIELIVMGYSIGTEIEIDYAELGVLKAQGFTKGKIRRLIAAQYLLAEFAGILIGFLAAVPLERFLSSVMISITAILPDSGLAVGKSLFFVLMILLVSVVIVVIKTRKVGGISPVRAISGGREEIYFDSRGNMPVGKRALSVRLALRQFTSGKKRYISTVMIAAILTFFMLTVNLLGNLVTSRKALESMGGDIADLDVWYQNLSAEEHIDEIEALVQSYTAITKKYYMNSSYVSLNGENLYLTYYKYPEYINGILKGRAPLYDNEIVITEMVSEALDIHMGDEVIISNKDQEAVYLISGIYQSMNDSGMCFVMSFEGAKKLGMKDMYYLGFVLEDASFSDEIAEALNERFGNIVSAEAYHLEEDGIGGDIELALDAVRIIIYVFSVLFALVVVRMVCSKAFVQERTDIGIYKALGFTSGRLRLQFAFRFLIVALIGAAFGTLLSAAFSARVLGSLLKSIGMSRVIVEFTPLSVLAPIAVVGVCFFVFAYLSSARIKSVAVRELVAE